RFSRDWSSDVCSSDLTARDLHPVGAGADAPARGLRHLQAALPALADPLLRAPVGSPAGAVLLPAAGGGAALLPLPVAALHGGDGVSVGGAAARGAALAFRGAQQPCAARAPSGALG